MQQPLSKEAPPWSKPPGSHTAMWSSPILSVDGPETHRVNAWAYSLREAGNFYFHDLGSLPSRKSSYPAEILPSEGPWREIRPESVWTETMAPRSQHPSFAQPSHCPWQGADLKMRHLGPCSQISPLMTIAPEDIKRSRTPQLTLAKPHKPHNT